MKRFITSTLYEWKNTTSRLPLLLRGARQVGKSYLVEHFAQEAFGQNYVIVNFEQRPELKSCFSTLEPQKIIAELEILTKKTIDIKTTLLFFDEVQECPSAIMALRYFKEQMPGGYVIAAGSLLEFALEQKDFRMPVGRVQFLYVKPLSFKEYLWNTNEKLCTYISNTTPLDKISDTVHYELLKQVYEYSVLGGMPAVIDTYFSTGSFKKAQEMQTVLLTTYQNDFAKYAKGGAYNYVQLIYEKAPGLIAQQFKYAHVTRDLQSRELKLGLEKLVKAGIIHKVYVTAANGLPFNALINEKKFKLLFVDVGLVKRATALDAELLLKKDLFLVNRGNLAEQFAGQELLAYQDCHMPPELFFWARDKKNANAEVDYVIHVNGSIIPIEVKAGSTGRLKSLQIFMREKNSKLGVKISSANLSLTNNILCLPIYLVSELSRLILETLQD